MRHQKIQGKEVDILWWKKKKDLCIYSVMLLFIFTDFFFQASSFHLLKLENLLR